MSVMKLQSAITCDATAITLREVDPAICPALTAGGHALLTIYTAQAAERVIATKCSGSTLTVVRNDATRDWPATACVRLEEIVSTPLPNECCDGLSEITFGPEFTVTRDGCAIRVALKKTGVVAGDYCGFTVNDTGQILDIPDNWPAACLPVFNPCGPCDDTGTGGTGGATAAYAVSYVPQTGAKVALGGNLQAVVEQIEDAVVALQNDVATSVEEVREGAGISITGLADYPVVSLAATGIAHGVYAGFEVDEFGRILSYTPSGAADHTEVTSDANGAIKIIADLSGPAPVYTVEANTATTANPGVVTITDLPEIKAGAVSDPSTVPDYSGVEAAITKALSDALPPSLPQATAIESTDLLILYRLSDRKFYQVGPDVLAKYLAPVGGIYDVSSASLQVTKKVGNVTRSAAGVFRVTMTQGMGTQEYHVTPTVIGTVNVFVVVRIVSATVFEMRFFNAAGAAVDPDGFSFTVSGW